MRLNKTDCNVYIRRAALAARLLEEVMDMLEKFIPSLVKDLELGDVSLAAGVPGSYALPLEDDLVITLNDIANGFVLKCAVAPYPKVQEELFSTKAMLGNLFGQGTKGAVLGLSNDGNTLTLNQVITYPVDYKVFRELLEDFINAVDFWHDEAKTYS